jgi:hypothetical protein
MNQQLLAPGHSESHVDEIIGNHGESYPAFQSRFSFISAAIESVAPLDHANAPFASGPPFLALAEPAFLLFPLALGAFGGAIGNADAFDTLLFRRGYR